MHSDLSSLSLSCDQLWDLWHHRLLPVAISSTRLVLPLPLVYRVARDFPSPPLPSLVHLPSELCCPQGSLRSFCPPGETLPHRGRRCPLATQLPLLLPGDPLWGVPPLRRPLPPPLLISLQGTHGPGFPAVRQPSPFTFFAPYGGLLLLVLPHPRRWRPRRPLRPLVRLPRRFPPIPVPLPALSFLPPLPPPRSLGLRRQLQLLRIFSTPHSAFVCALLRAFIAHTVLPP